MGNGEKRNRRALVIYRDSLQGSLKGGSFSGRLIAFP